ncbi:MAG: translation initiation factor IF-3 [Bdellovibrionaceae bacterium]|nr:translation initiation factor IF-3 [Pseudobdellovibrionaceae bacterium]
MAQAKFQRKKKAVFQRVNGRIRVPEVRVIDHTGAMLGVISTRDALAKAREEGLDLVEVAAEAKPPTCKIMDYGQWKYDSKKQAKENRKRQKTVSLREIQVRPRTGENDLNIKLAKAREFLEEGDKVKINLRFMGREMAHKDLGLQLIEKMIKSLKDIAIVETPPKQEGRHMFAIVIEDPKITKAKALKIKEAAKAAKAAERKAQKEEKVLDGLEKPEEEEKEEKTEKEEKAPL